MEEKSLWINYIISCDFFFHQQPHLLLLQVCSTTGSTQTPISLPLDSPFYLIAYGSKTCQAVRGTKSTLEFIYYETEFFTVLSLNDYGGTHPYGASRGTTGHVIFYCYYTREYHKKNQAFSRSFLLEVLERLVFMLGYNFYILVFD